MPTNTSVAAEGLRQQRAAQLRAEMEAKQRAELADRARAAQPVQADGQQQAETSDQEAQAASTGTGPVGTGAHEVQQGECISSIAKKTGHFWETIWKDAENAELKDVRKDPNVLLPGDHVHVPPLRPKQEPGETEMRHRFVRRGEPSKLALIVCRGGTPLGNESFTLEIDGKRSTGFTDPGGKLEVPIPGHAKVGKLTVGQGDNAVSYELELGQLDPITEISGVQARLGNLGFGCLVTSKWDEDTKRALREFQVEQGLTPTGQADPQTRAKLAEVHQSRRGV